MRLYHSTLILVLVQVIFTLLSQNAAAQTQQQLTHADASLVELIHNSSEEFSNIEGLGQIRFPKGNIKAAFEEIRQVLEREGVIDEQTT